MQSKINDTHFGKEKKCMTLMQQQAIDLITKLPDEKIYYLINFLQGFMEIQQIEKNELTSSQKAYQNLQKFRKKGTIDRDYKAELYAALEEKYENIS